MNRILTTLIAFMASTALTQAQDVWERPDAPQTEKTQKKEKKEKTIKISEDAKYLEGAVKEIDGKVTWQRTFAAPGKSAQEIYDKVMAFAKEFTEGENQLPESNVALVNKKEHIIVVAPLEWLVFKSSFISLDRAKFSYIAIATCKDGELDVKIDRLKYKYDESNNKSEQTIFAEEAINDKNALNKKKTKLVPGWAKFRRKTVDRMEEVLELFGNQIK